MLRLKSFLLIQMIALLGCGSSDLTPIDPGTTNTWQVVAPNEVGLDAEKLEAARTYAFQDDMHTQGVVVIKDGYLAAEWYAPDTDADTWATSWSIAKSFTSAMLGIAWGDGLFSSLEITMGTYIPEWHGTDRADITLRDVLTMSSGLKWDETYNLSGDKISEIARMVLEDAPMAVPVSQPLDATPGQRWQYSSGDTMLLGRVIEQLTGKNPTDYANDRLAEPLGLTQFDWWEDIHGNTYTFCCVDTTPRGFARFGQLYLQGGVWGGEQLVPAEWVRMTTQETANANPGYGLQWWLNAPNDEHQYPSLPTSAYFALGHDTQLIGVFPDQNMVIVRNGTYIKPENPAIAADSLFGGGLFSDNIGTTGSRPPEGDWSDDTFFRLILDALQQ